MAAALGEAALPPVAPASAAANARPVGTLDPQLFMAACRGDNNRLKELLRLDDDEGQSATRGTPYCNEVTSNEGNSLLHVVAARAGGDRFVDCAKTIYRGNSGLLAARNNKRDTPLHRAAGAGSADMISCLVALKAAEVAGDDGTAVKDFLRARNDCGETALHQAVRAASMTCIDALLLEDLGLATVPQEGEAGASPFYLALSLGKLDIARHIFDKSKGDLSYSGPNGQNVLHAAISRGEALAMLLNWFKDLTVDVQQAGDDRPAVSVPLVSHLAQQRDKKTGSNPLHLAASLEGWPYVGILSMWFPDVWPRPRSAVALLLEANQCAAYQPDAQGLYPIHVAAMAGSLDAVRAMLEACPDCATLRDAGGRTFLHAAVEAEAYGVVEFACRRAPPKGLFPSSVLNMQDDNGDTAVHRAVHVGNLPVFNCLIRNRHVHLSILNKDALTPYDLSWVRIPSSFYYDSNPRGLIQLSLQFVGAPCGGSRPDLLSGEHIPKGDDDEVSAHLTNAAQMLGVVSVLVATVTFASAFTLPGGYQQQAGSDGIIGTPLLAGSYAFDAFILSTTLAFICSCMATFSLIFAGVPAMDISLRSWYLEVSALLLRSSGRSLVVAFALGLYLVLAPIAHATATAVCVIIFVSLLYGNSEAWQILRVADTARARLGARMDVAWTFGLTFYNVFVNVFVNFWSFIIIFGYPAAIRMAVHVHAK
ncbi:hypothetical protein GQ55_2G354800 [Panicum hallii var. hallii]|uniref:PGG domain-containing protein n=1 Tax=Panicum hallii var. hallii TaxID=1504633 RepID=A0A2T7EVU5_9POAL|nr:hypothetical protein GQ55_2G354800 [Panicum hallii var. hallii]